MNKVFYTWEEFNEDVEKILQFIKNKKWGITQVYAIPKGGLPLGVSLANHLGCELITNISQRSKFYDNVLIVDDISDSGKTFLDIPKVYVFKTVTIYNKEGTQFKPNFNCRECKKDDWIVYPWEPKEKETKRDNDIKS